MASPLPPDPYLALGLPRDATAATIKTTYRKLILKFHPDKVQDAAQKQIASDQFHKVQTAYEIIGEEDRRARYDAQVKLVELRKEMLGKQGAGASAQSEARASNYSRMRTESPARPNYTARASERNERVHVEERRPYDAEPDYFDRPRSTARKDYEYERPSSKRTPPAPRTEKERVRASKQSSKENERARQKEKTRQTTRDTRRDREFKYSYPDPETASSSDSDGVVEPPRYARREEDERRRERDPYHEQPRRQKEESPRAFHMEDRSSHHKMQSHEMSARDYMERSGGRPRQYPESTRRPSPQRVSTKDKVEYIKRSEGRPPVMVRRGSGKPTPASREPEELPRRESPRRESPRRDRERTRRLSHDYSDLPRKTPPLNSTKSAPDQIHIPEAPRRAYSMQTDNKTETDFQPPPMRRADTMPNQLNARRERESTRKPPKSSGLRRTETTDSLPTPATTPEPVTPRNAKYPYGREYADDNEFATPNGYRTELHEPASGNRKVTRSPSPIKEERVKEERGRAASSRYPEKAQRPPLPSASRTTSYVYTPQGLQDMSAGRPGLSRAETARPDVPLYGEIPTSRSSPRQTRARHSPPSAEAQYQQYRPEDMKYQTGQHSRRASEAIRPGYARGNSYTSQAAY